MTNAEILTFQYEPRWMIQVCPRHPLEVRSLASSPPGEAAYCPLATADDPHKMVVVEVAPFNDSDALFPPSQESEE